MYRNAAKRIKRNPDRFLAETHVYARAQSNYCNVLTRWLLGEKSLDVSDLVGWFLVYALCCDDCRAPNESQQTEKRCRTRPIRLYRLNSSASQLIIRMKRDVCMYFRNAKKHMSRKFHKNVRSIVHTHTHTLEQMKNHGNSCLMNRVHTRRRTVRPRWNHFSA